jgi:hypothetical protein
MHMVGRNPAITFKGGHAPHPGSCDRLAKNIVGNITCGVNTLNRGGG